MNEEIKKIGTTPEGYLKCPVCEKNGERDHFVHMRSVSVNRGGDVVIVSSTGVKDEKTKNRHRGSEVTIACWCEGGHSFDVRFVFHKGVTFASTVPLPDFTDPEGILHGEDLWRD